MNSAKPRQYLLAVVHMMIATLAFLSAAGAQETPLDPTADMVHERPSQGPEGSPPVTGPAPSRAIRAAVPVQAATGKPLEYGSFLIYPEYAADWMYDSNVYYTHNPVGDHAMNYSLAVWAKSNWSRHALNFYAATDMARYARYTSENTNDARLSVEGRYDINTDTNFYGGIRRSSEHLDRESPDARNGITPTPYIQDKAYAGFFRHFERVSLRVAGTWQHLNFEDVPFLPGSGGPLRLINNDDRDRHQYTGGVRLGYELTPNLEPYVLAAADNRRYDNKPDDTGYVRDSRGQRYVAGLRWIMPKELKLDMFAGHMRQKYDDSQLASVSTPVFGGSMLWAATSKLGMWVDMDRTIEETTLTQTLSDGPPPVLIVASGYTNTYSSIGANYKLNDKFALRGNVSASKSKYNGLNRTDDYYGAGIGGEYRVSRNFLLHVNYAYRNLHSSSSAENFIKRQVFVGMVIPMSN